MATDNQLRARVDPSHAERIDTLAREQSEGERTEAERKAIEEGLRSLGYLERPVERHELLLWYVRRVGIGLGFLGLVSMGFGVFGARVFSLVGFGLALGGFLLVAVEEFLDEYSGQLDANE